VPEERPFVAFAIGANWPNKRWPAEHFAALADRLYHAHYIPVLVGGGCLDETIAQDIVRASEIPPVNLVGRTNLKQLAHVFTRAALVLGGDTGPVHLAAGLRTPTVMPRDRPRGKSQDRASGTDHSPAGALAPDGALDSPTDSSARASARLAASKRFAVSIPQLPKASDV